MQTHTPFPYCSLCGENEEKTAEQEIFIASRNYYIPHNNFLWQKERKPRYRSFLLYRIGYIPTSSSAFHTRCGINSRCVRVLLFFSLAFLIQAKVLFQHFSACFLPNRIAIVVHRASVALHVLHEPVQQFVIRHYPCPRLQECPSLLQPSCEPR